MPVGVVVSLLGTLVATAVPILVLSRVLSSVTSEILGRTELINIILSPLSLCVPSFFPLLITVFHAKPFLITCSNSTQ